jgi:hypothetical protein
MTTEMCQHIIDHGTTDTHMVLIVTESESAFTCPQCTAEYCIALLDAGTPAAHVLDSLVFEACDHGQGTCDRCVEAFKDELSKRWMRYRLAGDKPASNRLGRLRKAIRKRYDTSEATLPAYPGLRRTGRGLDAAKAGQRWQGLRAQRLTALAPPVHTVLVVPAS